MYKKILKELNKIKIIDTHEHFSHEKDLLNYKIDVISLMTPYLCDVLECAGMSRTDWQKANDYTLDFEERFNLILPFMENIKYTTYYASYENSIKYFCKDFEFNLEKCKAANKKLCLFYNGYSDIFSSLNIEKALTFVGFDISYFNDSILIPIPTVSEITPANREDIIKISKSSEVDITDFESFEKALEKIFEVYRQHNIPAIKLGNAYKRKLDFKAIDREKAQEVFNKILNGADYSTGEKFGVFLQNNVMSADIKTLDDFIVEKYVSLCEENNMAVVIHTGIHAWNNQNVSHCHAEYLSDIIKRHSKCKFVLLHCGIPFYKEAILLARYFNNVYLDLTWAHYIDRAMTVSIIESIVELLPSNKIFAFGGDYCLPHNLYGALPMALQNIAIAFSNLIKNKKLDYESALEIANKWLYENPKRIYRL